ncbi:S53 family peptidase [Frondihabitans australicus]|uniref:Pro-kumamolisin-like protein n=1 Tax=Frondihabitans australicus TaxID=386892 RepID=A0A495IE23_9MICO|nr:S53 family peptidase [Frondihabitans australicus]RKR74254.1 pro-kumamolisin-like protein [Frondihabitans australicus]
MLAALAAAATAIALSSVVASPASAVATRHAIPDSSPHWLSHAKAVSTPSSASKVTFGILLNMRNTAQANAQVAAVSNPSSASYGKYLTNAQFKATYAPTAASVKSVQSWLTSQGFSLGTTLSSGMYVTATGTTAQVEKTFGTSLKNYSYQGKTVQTNTTTLSLPDGTPATVVSSVNGVIGLDQAVTYKKPAETLPGPPAGARYGVQPCSAYYGQQVASNKPDAYGKKAPYAVCGYGSAQLQGAYGESSLIKAGYTGKGVTVAITDAYAAPTIAQDAALYAKRQGQPGYSKGQFTQITPGPDQYDLTADSECGASGWYGEETLDVEAVHAMAPGAKIVYVGAQDCSTGLDEAWAASIDNHVADIITNSWSEGIDDIADLGQSYVDFYEQYSTEAALTGISVTFSSGDDGDGTAGGTNLSAKTVGFPSDLPYVTGVGGTSVLINSKSQWQGEYGWQSSYSAPLSSSGWGTLPGTYSSGGGGGTSTLFTQPFYQKGVVPTSVSEAFGTTPMRAVPDISMVGDPNTGMLVGETQAFADGTYYDEYRIGGTSLSSPLLAGVLAVASQYSHRTLGFVNPLYYKMLGTSAIHDIVAPKSPIAQVRTDFVNGVDNSAGKTYKVQTIDVQSTTLHDTKGYDDETGVGTPNGPNFFAAVKSLTKKR